jgi:hypothetical protein
VPISKTSLDSGLRKGAIGRSCSLYRGSRASTWFRSSRRAHVGSQKPVNRIPQRPVVRSRIKIKRASPKLARNGPPAMSAVWSLSGGKRTWRLRAPTSENDPTETSSGIGSAINLKSANALGIDVPATLLGAPPSVLWVAHGHDLMMRGQHSLAG